MQRVKQVSPIEDIDVYAAKVSMERTAKKVNCGLFVFCSFWAPIQATHLSLILVATPE